MNGGGVIIGPAGSGASLVLNSGQHFGDEHPGGGGGPILGPGYGAQNQAFITPNTERHAVLTTLLVFVATALSMVEAYLLAVTFDCLMAANDIKVLGLSFSGISVALAIIAACIELRVKCQERGESHESSNKVGSLETDARPKSNCVRNFGQICEDLSIVMALLPTLMSLVFKASDVFAKTVAVVVLVAAIMPFYLGPHQTYPCRKVVSCFIIVCASAMFIFTFLSVENDKSLVIYNFSDSRTNQTFRIARQEDQVEFDGLQYCETFEGVNPCSPCFTTAVYGRGNNTWTSSRNDTGQCTGVTLSVDQAFDCTDFGTRKPITVSVFLEDSCAVVQNLTCDLNTLPGLII